MSQPGMSGVPGERLGAADAELLRLEAAASSVARSLVELDDNTARKDLDKGPLTGATAAAWADATAALTELWNGYSLLTDLVKRSRELRGQRRFTDTDRIAYVEQVLGRSITLSTTIVPLAQRGLLGAGQVVTACTPAELLAAMEAAFATVVAVAVRAGETWDRLLPATADVAVAVDRVRQLSRAAGAGTATVDDADARLQDFVAMLACDPFGCTDAELDAIRAVVDRADAERTSAADLRATLTRRLAAAHTLADEVAAAVATAVTAEQMAADRFAPGAITDGASGPDPRADLAAIDALASAGQWQLIGGRLSAWTRLATARRDAASTAAARNTALMSDRAELRGRLDAYQAKAARRGWAEHPTLSPLSETARTLLWTVPCDLDAARIAVGAYQEAIADLTATTAKGNQQ
jgi:hypothetical protein